MRGSGSGPPRRAAAAALGLGAAALAVTAAAWWLAGGRLPAISWLEGPDAGVRRALTSPRFAARAAVPGTGATLRVERLAFRDVRVEAGGGRAAVTAVADVEGAVEWGGRAIRVSHLGLERIPLVRCAGRGWCPEADPLPRLSALLATLVRRAAAFEAGDAEGYRPLVSDGYRGEEGGKGALLARLAGDLAASPRSRLRPLAWQVRVERETAVVGEDCEVAVGGAPPRRLRARLELRDEGGIWRFTGGL